MHKLLLLTITLLMAISFIGCRQQQGLSEEEVSSMVQAEVTRQLASERVRDIVGQELSSQVASGKVRDIMRTEVTSQLATFNDIVRQEVTRQLAGVNDMVRREVISQLDGIDTLELSELHIKNRDGQSVIILGASVYGDGGLLIFSRDGEKVAHVAGSYEEIVAEIGASSSNDGLLGIYDKYGKVTFSAPAP